MNIARGLHLVAGLHDVRMPARTGEVTLLRETVEQNSRAGNLAGLVPAFVQPAKWRGTASISRVIVSDVMPFQLEAVASWQSGGCHRR